MAALLYHGRALEGGNTLTPLSGMHEIVAVEDYQVPRVLHEKKVLTYSPKLLSMIAEKKIIRRHSRPEVEIRAATTAANGFILEELNSGLTDPSHPDYWDIVPLDGAEWFDGRKATLPHHLTPTTAY